MKAHLTLLIFLLLSSLQISANKKANPTKSPLSPMSHKSQDFIQNKGQIIDQNNKPNKAVLFLYNGSGLHIQLRQNGFSYEVIKTAISSQPLALSENKQGPDSYNQQPVTDSIYIHRVDILFDGGNKNAQIKAFEPSIDYINYYTTGTGEAGITNVHHYQKIVYTNIYPKIDVEFVLNPNSLTQKFKYNFIIHPGGNINDIKLKFLGATSTSLTEDGHIAIETAYGNIDESIPYSYLSPTIALAKEGVSSFVKAVPDKEEIKARFTFVSKNIFGIEAKNYDPTKTLVIDPSPWATYFGGGSSDKGVCITHDASGNLIMGGSTISTTNIATSGAYQSSLAGLNDAFFAKFNLAGALQWSTYFGGSENDGAMEICTDGSGNIIAAMVSGSTGLATTGAYQTALSGLYDAMILKLNPSGMRMWSTYYGGSGEDYAFGLTQDLSGNIYITGSTNSSNGIAITGAFKTTFGGGNDDAFVAKFSPGGFPIWATYFGDNGGDAAGDIAVDGNNNVLITGDTYSYTGIATSGAFQTIYAGGNSDAYIAKFNASGTILQWATYYGSTGVERAKGLTSDTSGNIYIIGETASVTNIASVGAYQETHNGGIDDAFIAKFSPAGLRLWATYYGGEGLDHLSDILYDPIGNLYITGSTTSKTKIAIAPSYQDTNAGGYDAFLLKINTSGIPQWATYFGGYGWDDGFGICLDVLGNLAISGAASSINNIATPGAWQTTNAGGYDAFLFCIPVAISPGINNNNISANQGICTGTIPQTLVGSTPIGGGGTYVYSWLSSTTGSTSGFTLAGGTNNAINYSPPALTANTWYKRAVSSGTYYDTSNVVAISVGSKPIISAITGNTTVNNLSVQTYSVTTNPGSSYQWFFTHGTGTSSSNSINISWNTVGTTVLKVVETTAVGCNGDTVYLNITINSATGNNISRNQGICTGYVPQTLTGSIPVGGGPFVYTWLSSVINANTGFTLASGTSNGINYSPPALTTSTWYKRVVSAAGIDDTSNVVAILVGSVKLNVGFTVNAMIQCIKTNNFIFTDTTSGSNTHFWDFGNGTTSTLANPNVSYNFNIANAYWVRLESSINGGCIDSAKQRVFVINNPAPTGAIVGNSVVTRLSTHTYSVPATMGSSYQWIFTNGIGSSNSNNISIKWNAIGTIDLKVIEFSGGGSCAGDTVYQTITINPGVGLEGYEPNDGFKVYPNPTSGIFNITSNQIEPYQINVFDMLGKQIYQAKSNSNNLVTQLDLSDYDDGVYSIQMINEDGNSIVQKILLIR